MSNIDNSGNPGEDILHSIEELAALRRKEIEAKLHPEQLREIEKEEKEKEEEKEKDKDD